MFPLRFIRFLIRFLIFLFYFPILIPSVIFISTMFKLVQYSPQVFSSELLHSQGLYFDFRLDWLDFIISSETIFLFFFMRRGHRLSESLSSFFCLQVWNFLLFLLFFKFSCLTMVGFGVHELFQVSWNMVYPVNLYFSCFFNFIKQFLLVHS